MLRRNKLCALDLKVVNILFLVAFFVFCFLFFPFLGLLSRHMEVPRLGGLTRAVAAGYTRATATRDLSRVCDLHHSSRQRLILNPLREARDQTQNLMAPSQIR